LPNSLELYPLSMSFKYKQFRSRILSSIVAIAFVLNTMTSYAQTISGGVFSLPQPGAPLSLSAGFVPAHITGLTIHPENPLQFDFLIDTGDKHLKDEELKAESMKLMKYFMASLTVPDEEMWVNLSPYEKNRVIAKGLSQTDMGRDMLGQDYILKQLTASLLSPENELGKKFWDKVRAQAKDKFGKTEIPTDTFNKIWIVPQRASVYVEGKSVYVVDGHLKVMLEEDYIAMGHEPLAAGSKPQALSAKHTAQSEEQVSSVMREIILPAIEHEVNEGQNFAQLRQIFYSMILATWYKGNLKKSALIQAYANRNKVDGIDIDDKDVSEKIYNQYLEAFKKGVYNLIKEDYDPATQEITSHKYFTGGEDFAQLAGKMNAPDAAQLKRYVDFHRNRDHAMLTAGINPVEHQSNAQFTYPVQKLKEDMRSIENKLPAYRYGQINDEEWIVKNRSLWESMVKVAEETHIAAHGTARSSFASSSMSDDPTYRWALLGIMISGKIIYGNANKLKPFYANDPMADLNPYFYGPFFVVLTSSHESNKGAIINVDGLSKEEHAIYLIPDAAEREFFVQGIKKAVEKKLMTQLDADDALSKLMTFQEFIDHKNNIRDIVEGRKNASEVVASSDRSAAVKAKSDRVMLGHIADLQGQTLDLDQFINGIDTGVQQYFKSMSSSDSLAQNLYYHMTVDAPVDPHQSAVSNIVFDKSSGRMYLHLHQGNVLFLLRIKDIKDKDITFDDLLIESGTSGYTSWDYLAKQKGGMYSDPAVKTAIFQAAEKFMREGSSHDFIIKQNLIIEEMRQFLNNPTLPKAYLGQLSIGNNVPIWQILDVREGEVNKTASIIVFKFRENPNQLKYNFEFEIDASRASVELPVEVNPVKIPSVDLATTLGAPALLNLFKLKTEEMLNTVDRNIRNSNTRFSLIEDTVRFNPLLAPFNIGGLNPVFVAYDISVKELINPHNQPLVGVYGAAGADISNFILATNAKHGYFVDRVKLDFVSLQKEVELYNQNKKRFIETEFTRGKYSIGYMNILGVEPENYHLLIMEELASMKAHDVIATQAKDGSITLQFSWLYPGSASSDQYQITFFTGVNILKPWQFPSQLKDILARKIDVYFQKAGMILPGRYPQYLAPMASAIKVGGYMLTDDSSVNRKKYDPRIELKARGKEFTEDLSDNDQQISYWASHVHYSSFYEEYGWRVNVRQKMSDNFPAPSWSRSSFVKISVPVSAQDRIVADAAMISTPVNVEKDFSKAPWFIKAHVSKLYHDLTHSTVVPKFAYLFALARGREKSWADYLYLVGILHDYDPDRPSNTPARVPATIEKLKQDWSGRRSLDGREGHSFLKETLKWNEEQFLTAIVIIRRSEFPLVDNDSHPNKAEYTNKATTPFQEYKKALQDLKDYLVKQGENPDSKLVFLRQEAYVFSEFADKSISMYEKTFEASLKHLKDLIAEIQERRRIEHEAPLNEEEFIGNNFGIFIKDLGSENNFKVDQALDKEFGGEINFLTRDALASMPEFANAFERNRQGYETLFNSYQTSYDYAGAEIIAIEKNIRSLASNTLSHEVEREMISDLKIPETKLRRSMIEGTIEVTEYLNSSDETVPFMRVGKILIVNRQTAQSLGDKVLNYPYLIQLESDSLKSQMGLARNLIYWHNGLIGNIAAMLKHEDRIRGSSFVDFGAGESGILTIVANLLGAKEFFLYENDPSASGDLVQNLKTNGVTDSVISTTDFRLADELKPHYPLVAVSNISNYGAFKFKDPSKVQLTAMLRLAQKAKLFIVSGGSQLDQQDARTLLEEVPGKILEEVILRDQENFTTYLLRDKIESSMGHLADQAMLRRGEGQKVDFSQLLKAQSWSQRWKAHGFSYVSMLHVLRPYLNVGAPESKNIKEKLVRYYQSHPPVFAEGVFNNPSERWIASQIVKGYQFGALVQSIKLLTVPEIDDYKSLTALQNIVSKILSELEKKVSLKKENLSLLSNRVPLIVEGGLIRSKIFNDLNPIHGEPTVKMIIAAQGQDGGLHIFYTESDQTLLSALQNVQAAYLIGQLTLQAPDGQLKSFSGLKATDAAMMSSYIEELKNTDPAKRIKAALFLGEIQNKKAIESLLKTYIAEPDLDVQRALIEALGDLVDSRIVPVHAARISKTELMDLQIGVSGVYERSDYKRALTTLIRNMLLLAKESGRYAHVVFHNEPSEYLDEEDLVLRDIKFSPERESQSKLSYDAAMTSSSRATTPTSSMVATSNPQAIRNTLAEAKQIFRFSDKLLDTLKEFIEGRTDITEMMEYVENLDEVKGQRLNKSFMRATLVAIWIKAKYYYATADLRDLFNTIYQRLGNNISEQEFQYKLSIDISQPELTFLIKDIDNLVIQSNRVKTVTKEELRVRVISQALSEFGFDYRLKEDINAFLDGKSNIRNLSQRIKTIAPKGHLLKTSNAARLMLISMFVAVKYEIQSPSLKGIYDDLKKYVEGTSLTEQDYVKAVSQYMSSNSNIGELVSTVKSFIASSDAAMIYDKNNPSLPYDRRQLEKRREQLLDILREAERGADVEHIKENIRRIDEELAKLDQNKTKDKAMTSLNQNLSEADAAMSVDAIKFVLGNWKDIKKIFETEANGKFNLSSISNVVNAARKIAYLNSDDLDYIRRNVDEPTIDVINKLVHGIQLSLAAPLAMKEKSVIERLLALGMFVYLNKTGQQFILDIVRDTLDTSKSENAIAMINYIDALYSLDDELSRVETIDPYSIVLGDAQRKVLKFAIQLTQGDQKKATLLIRRAVKGLNPSQETQNREPVELKRAQGLDSAMLQNPGGIDMNSNQMQLKTEGQPMNIEFSTPDFQMPLENIQGFQPVIINIQPLTAFPLLGANHVENKQQVSLAR
jgi:hypothetical protein